MRPLRYPRLAYLAHRCPGRLRFRLRWLRQDPAAANRLADALSALPGVVDVELRPYTGAVLVRFAPERVGEERVVEALLRATGLSRLSTAGEETEEEMQQLIQLARSNGSELARALLTAIRSLDVHLLRLSDGEVSLGTLVSLGLLGTAAARLAQTARLELPEWYELAWWSFRTFATTEANLIGQTLEEAEEQAPARGAAT